MWGSGINYLFLKSGNLSLKLHNSSHELGILLVIICRYRATIPRLLEVCRCSGNFTLNGSLVGKYGLPFAFGSRDLLFRIDGSSMNRSRHFCVHQPLLARTQRIGFNRARWLVQHRLKSVFCFFVLVWMVAVLRLWASFIAVKCRFHFNFAITL